jgi:hypothetical protein
VDTEGLVRVLDCLFGQGGSSHEIGSAPKPKKFHGKDAHQQFLTWYDGYDVNNEEEKRLWQRMVLLEVTSNAKYAKIKKDKLPDDFGSDVNEAIEQGQNLGLQLAMAKGEEEETEVSNAACCKSTFGLTRRQTMEAEDQQDYYTMKSAFTGTENRAGPPADLCLRLLDCIQDPNNPDFVIPQILKKVTDRHFYVFQVTGAIGAVLKLYGRIDVEKLLVATEYLNHPKANDIRAAAAGLEDLLIHGCILADDVGFGKTIQSLTVVFFHSILYDKKGEDGEVVCEPSLLVVPATVINQWLAEIRQHWPYFELVISYEDHNFKAEMAMNSLSHTAMREYPSLEAVPGNLQYIFDKKEPRALRTIVITSYETHKLRTGIKMTKNIPGKPYKPARFDDRGDPIWKRPPRKLHYWITKHDGTYSLVIADESQKVKNYSTGLWTVLYLQNFRKTLLLTATPMYNSAKVSSSHSLTPQNALFKSTFRNLPFAISSGKSAFIDNILVGSSRPSRIDLYDGAHRARNPLSASTRYLGLVNETRAERRKFGP